MRGVAAFMLLALAFPGAASSSQKAPGGREDLDDFMSCSEILADEHIQDADKHGSKPYRLLVDLYREKECPAPDFHSARIGAVNQRNIQRLSGPDRGLNCKDLLVEKTLHDELTEWHSTMQGQASPAPLGRNIEGAARIGRPDLSEMLVRAQGFDSLYQVNNCDSVLSNEEEMLAKEVHRAPLRYARRSIVRQRNEAENRRIFGDASAVDLALSCDELVREIRLEEDNRIYHHGTQSRTIAPGGSHFATAFGGLIFGEWGALLGFLVDAQSFALAKRMTKREGRLLNQLNRESCYFEFSVNPEQQKELSALVENLSEEDRSLPCDVVWDGSLSSMARLKEKLSDASGGEGSPYHLFWSGRESGALSDRDAGLILLAELQGCQAEDT